MSSAFADALGHPEAQRLLAAPAVLQAMLEVEAALAAAQAELGLIPAEHAQAIAACCAQVDWPVEALVEASRSAGSLAIPLAAELTRRVRQASAPAAASVHFGATSQDLIDTALALQGRRVLRLIMADLDRLLAALSTLDQRHGAVPMLARTLMQPATVTTLGLRLRNGSDPLVRCRNRLPLQADRALRLQLGGPVGTGHAWGAQAGPLVLSVARRLGLPADVACWQAQRDEIARLAAELGVLVGAVAKVATDVALMAQAEVGELRESAGAGRGGSSAMPHKRNPVGSLVVLAAAQRVPPRVSAVLACMAVEQERGLGGWQAEVAEVAEILILSAAAVQAMADALSGAEVDAARLRHNIEAQRGLPMAEALARHWAPTLGRDEAHRRVQGLCARVATEGLHLRTLARAAGLPGAEALEALFDPDAAARGPSDSP